MTTKFQNLVRALRRNERGLTTVEYVIVLCLIAAISVSTWQVFGANIKRHLGDASTNIEDQLSH